MALCCAHDALTTGPDPARALPKIHQTWRILEANRDNELDCKFLIQIVAGSPTEFSIPPVE